MGKHRIKRRPPMQRDCKQCGERFLAPQNQVVNGGGLYCNAKCRQESQKQPRPVFTCQCCGKVFVSKYRQQKNRKFCSRECSTKARPKPVKKWLGGRPHAHDKWTLAVILRDKKCVRCGTVENLQAHHLKPWKHHPELRYDMENGTTLCPLCHHAQHPYLPLERFVASGGKEVKYCVVCETAFLVRKKTQRVCSRKCGWKLKNGQMAAAMGRRPA
jgi:5-methylcytosine-specific restriction endonuclease McrA